MILFVLVLLGLAFALFFGRLIVGPSLADRAMALDGMVVCGISTLVVRAIDTGDATFLPVAVVFTLVNFIGTAVIARFIEGQGR